jgi:hypothetical protein
VQLHLQDPEGYVSFGTTFRGDLARIGGRSSVEKSIENVDFAVSESIPKASGVATGSVR